MTLVIPDALSQFRAPQRRQAQLPTTAVLGAGHGGLALAGYLAQMGALVHLWNRTLGPLQAVIALGGIRLNDVLAKPSRVSASIEQVLSGAEIVLVAVPASNHREIARLCASHMVDGQMILLMPGKTGGAMEFMEELRRNGCQADVTVAEAQTFPFASRMPAPGMTTVSDVKRAVSVAALPADRTATLVDRCLPLLPMLVPAASVLTTSLENMSAILHPVITLMNASRIEGSKQGFLFYAEGVTPTVAAMLEAADAERQAIAKAYGVATRSLKQWLADTYGQKLKDLGQALVENPAYREVPAPTNFMHRYVVEDVPTGLVPLALLGAAAGVACPTIDSVINLACAVTGCDYWTEGRTLAAMGLAQLGPEAIRGKVEPVA